MAQQAGGNRARFFAPQASKSTTGSPTISTNPDTLGRDGSFSVPTLSNSGSFGSGDNTVSASGAVVALSNHKLLTVASASPRLASEYSEDEIIAQRTRTVETETLFKAKKERHGRLNVSGLIKHKNIPENPAEHAPPSATIEEVIEHDELGDRSPRQYSRSAKLIANPGPSSSSTLPPFTPPSAQRYPSDMPPSNQLGSFKNKLPPRYTSHSESPTEDGVRSNQSSHTVRSDASNTHIPSRLSSSTLDDSIKNLTTAFNRKHSASSKSAAPRYASPIPYVTDERGRRHGSPHILHEDDGLTSAFPGDRRLDGRRTSAEHEDGSNRTAFQDSRQYGGFVHARQELHDMRGQKRDSDASVEDGCVDASVGKRPRTDIYDDLSSHHGADSPMSDSPQPDGEESQHTAFKGAVPPDHHDPAKRDPRLKMILGHDVDEYVALHIDRYEAARKRWTDCSREEWERGADELVEKVTRVLEFVKDHVRRKVTLYASLHSRIDEHQQEREETAEMLKNAKSKLVAKTGVVVHEGKF